MRAMNSYYYDFKLDRNGPHKVSIESYIERETLALMIIDMQKPENGSLLKHKFNKYGSLLIRKWQ